MASAQGRISPEMDTALIGDVSPAPDISTRQTGSRAVLPRNGTIADHTEINGITGNRARDFGPDV